MNRKALVCFLAGVVFAVGHSLAGDLFRAGPTGSPQAWAFQLGAVALLTISVTWIALVIIFERNSGGKA